MKKILGLTLLCSLFAVGCAQNSSVIYDERFSEVRDTIIDQVESGTVPSISVAVAEHGEIVWEESFGLSDLENRVQATPHTLFRLGSISKNVTATGLMVLVEKGLIDLDTPAIEYLPEDVRLRGYEVDGDQITVRQLLNHRSGMPAYAEIFYEDDPEGPRPLAETVRRYGIVTYPSDWAFIYCNLGYQLAASMIAEVSGQTYTEFIEEKVFKPLGMTHASVYEGLPLAEPCAVPYTPSLARIPAYQSSYPGAENVCVSAHDLLRLAMFHLKDHLPDQEAILSDQAIGAMQQEYPPGNTTYGLGWRLDGTDHGHRSVYHGGSGPGANCFMRIFPDDDLAFVVLCNGELDKLYDIQKSIYYAMIPELKEPEPEIEAETERESTEEAGPEPPSYEKSDMHGTWRGTIIAYDRELDVEVMIDTTGARVTVNDQPAGEVEIYVLTHTFLLGMFDAKIPTPDNERYRYRNRLAVVRDGDRTFGAVISVGKVPERAGHYELASRIELRRSSPE